MKRRYWLGVVLGAMCVAALPGGCGGKVVLDSASTAGTGGEGGAPGPASASVVSSTSGFTVATAVGQGGGPLQDCVSCAEFLTDGAGDLCPASGELYKDLYYCVCGLNCIPQCGDNACGSGQNQVTQDCTACIQASCWGEFSACSNDI